MPGIILAALNTKMDKIQALSQNGQRALGKRETQVITELRFVYK